MAKPTRQRRAGRKTLRARGFTPSVLDKGSDRTMWTLPNDPTIWVIETAEVFLYMDKGRSGRGKTLDEAERNAKRTRGF